MAKRKQDTGKKLFDSQDTASVIPNGFYSGDKPNTSLRAFVTEAGHDYNPVSDDYAVSAFEDEITIEKRKSGSMDLHIYWSKKHHDAVRQYVRHFTSKGDLILDPFSGSGGTALSAVLEGRAAIAIDRSPAATFITKNYCATLDYKQLHEDFLKLTNICKIDMQWLYATRCDRCDGSATTAYVVYSQVFQCSRCLEKNALFDCPEVKVEVHGKSKSANVCPSCLSKGRHEVISTRSEPFGSIPVLVSYFCLAKCKPTRSERRHNDSDSKKRKYFKECDLAKILEIDGKPIPYWYPSQKMMNIADDTLPWGEEWRQGRNFRSVPELFTKRNLWALAALFAGSAQIPTRDFIRFIINTAILTVSRMCRHDYPSVMAGSYYLPQVCRELNVWDNVEGRFSRKSSDHKEMMDYISGVPKLCISTQSACDLAAIPANSVDYIFTDPPYAEKVQYGELNFIWEAWQGFDTTWHSEEIIVNGVRGHTEALWADMMRRSMSECYRVLKPGRWLSLCYHDTSEGTWELIQDIMAEAGFYSAQSEAALYIDTGQKSFNQLNADKVTKRDLVLNFRKPKPLPFKVTRIYGPEDADKLPKGGDIATFTEFARQIVKDFLTHHPGATKDRIYDELVSRLVGSRSMEAHDFDALLRSVAEEVQQPVKKDLFHNKEADLFGSHIQSRWYLKETADQVDQAEQAKEDAAAARLAKFIGEYLKKKPELEGVHYSDLFEQFLPVHDKPRRLLADWLPEYFIKTPSGTWRLPEKDESQQLAKLREAGTLRRIKRFANALIDGVPIRDKDRPGSDVNLLDWLRQCRRAGLYDQGKAIYEKGGLNLANLNDEQQIEAEDDYRICSRRGSTEEAKPKRQRRKKQDDEE
ncbi:DNA methyltransferase [Fimbriiglobus ruber]|uniref:DNA methylase N-4/N-6 domain-containing protein n=1 Tax=Fimbriiglobus ruber TaxID=1908690 RepID=A0A225DVE8_9BACT|nr:DNA methyltransferase [Fimbriiglobus ruber]OWK45510.1 hypothetical protein FRUB_01841 [Fimbriiglobus ruber]